MKRQISKISIMLLLIITLKPAFARQPRVIEAVPDNGERNVDPALNEIRIVFGQDMSDGGFSVCGGGDKFPKIIGNPQWADNRTLIMKVKLIANKEYSFSINCPSAKNFRSVSGESAVPYPITFRTGKAGAGVKQTKTATGNSRKATRELRRAIKENYSYYDLRGVNWNMLFRANAKKLRGASTPEQFADVAAEILANAEDMHIWLKVDGKHVNVFRRQIERNYDPEFLKNNVPNFQQLSGAVYTGRYDDGIGYILIDSWSNNRAQALEQAYAAIWEFGDASGLIIDVRPNGGGAEPLAQKFAGCFIDEPVVYAKHVYRSKGAPGRFGQVNDRVLGPNKYRPRYRGKVAVLMGQANMSSCEAFLLMMKQVPNCKLIGEKSYGSSGNPKPVDLGNGVTVYLPSWKAMRPDGSCFEGQGIEPDIAVSTTRVQLSKIDPVLDKALEWLRKL